MIGAATISIARQTDRPVELLSVRADVRNPSALVAHTFELPDRPRPRVAGPEEISGILVAVRAKELVIGDQIDGVIVTLPRSSVTSMAIGPRLDQRGPPVSLLSRLVDDPRWSLTPLEMWCANLRYGWNRIFRACQLAPTIETDDPLAIRKDRIRGIKVSCPKSAEEGCRGFILVVTRKPVATRATVLPLEFPAQSFAIDAGRSRSVLVPVKEDGLFKQLADDASDHGDLEVGVRIRLAMEAAGEAVVERTTAVLLVSAPTTGKKPAGKKKSKKKKAKKKKAKAQGEGSTKTTTTTTTKTTRKTERAASPGARQGDGGDADPEPSATTAPEQTATAEPTPTDTDPLPPQEDTMPAPTPAVESSP